ncbi:baseplate J/gp47 family protein [Aquimarina macrocephali]|uniref:baseplate J/gp47 family protein n=1 Tax=Aquimarina macrocephali TaxID=666563 RepID=UPI000466C77D|nr:baseplate J/gp47 family protein [Aquimarina macrocephali]
MRNKIKTHQLLFRDGASKQNDTIERLAPSYVRVENRSMEQLIQEAQRLAKELVFVDNKNQARGTWESFLIEDPDSFYKASETGKESLRKQWASQLAAYVENPDRFLKNQDTKQKLASPHTVLFLTFLKLLQHIKEQINGLTQKHLDFYYRKRLGLSPKKAIPDMINVLIELVEEETQLALKKGTVFLAGEDEEGNELYYTTTENTIINQAKIAQLKNVFVDKQTFTIAGIHRHHLDTPDKGVSVMMQMALGTPNPGDSLPDMPNGFQELTDMLPQINGNEAVQRYIIEALLLSIEEFQLIFQKQAQEKNGEFTNWLPIYELLEDAYGRKTRSIRKDLLTKIREEQGFTSLLKQIYGDPNPGDQLPTYRGREASFERIFEDLKSSNTATQQVASEFIEETLKLKVPDFAFILDTSSTTEANEAWEEVYSLLEVAERQVRRISIQTPTQEKTLNIYAANDTEKLAFSRYNDTEECKRFKTFGNVPTEATNHLQAATLGFAVSDPVLLLKEGQRTITLFQQLDIDDERFIKLEKLINKGIIRIYLSSKEQWFIPREVSIELGDFLKSTSGISLSNVTIANDTLTITEDTAEIFEVLEKDKIVVDTDGTSYRLLSDIVDKSVPLRRIGKVNELQETITLYHQEQVFVKSIKTEIKLTPEEEAVEVFNTSNTTTTFIQADMPSLVMTVDPDIVDELNKQSDLEVFDCLMDLQITKMGLCVAVTGLQNISIQNDQSTINPKKPFEPFGLQPSRGAGLYFTNEEIAKKVITDLQLHPEWVNQPDDFTQHYENYWKVEQDTLIPEAKDQKIKSNNDFTTSLFVYHNFTEIPVADQVPLFAEEQLMEINNVPSLLQKNRPSYRYSPIDGIDTDQNEVTDWRRYFKLELNAIDFQHELYNSLFARQTFSENPDIRKLIIPLPYQPKLKSLKLSYTAEANVLLEDQTRGENQKIFHVHPFGYKTQRGSERITLFPKYEDNGSLYLGVSECIPPQIINILFQLAEGSADPDVGKPVVDWSYLKNNEWRVLDTSDIISDTTNGLLNSGVVSIRMPEDATTGNSLLPDHLHWFRVSVAQHIEGIADTIAIKTQVVQAILSNDVVATTHFNTPLKEESITETQQFIPEIKSVSQPFTSSQGKPAEEDLHFNQRISQRLRHKNRALTMWDYEHLVLDAFPEVYKVKCLPQINQLGKVVVTVVPDIRKNLPFQPFNPKVAADVLSRIHEFLEQRAPVVAEISVNNPTYLQVATRCTVKFNQGLDAIFYRNKLIEEIKRFLSPWAFDDAQDIRLGGMLDSGVLVNFIAERPYIDFVANLKLFQSIDGKGFTDVTSLPHKKNAVIPDQPDMIIVSAANHFIDIADENTYDEDAEKGINYMIVETDLVVAKDFLIKN